MSDLKIPDAEKTLSLMEQAFKTADTQELRRLFLAEREAHLECLRTLETMIGMYAGKHNERFIKEPSSDALDTVKAIAMEAMALARSVIESKANHE